MNRADKAKIIEKIKGKAEKANIALVTDFKGLKVEELNEIRVKLRGQGVEYQVVKNTLARQALTDTPHEVISHKFKECCAVAFGYDDPVAVAKVLTDFAKQSKKFSLRFASLDGRFLNEQAIQELSKLPGREQLLAKLLGTFNAVPTNFVGLFANMLRNLLYALNGIKEQKAQG